MESRKPYFQPWRDYMGLADMVKAMQRAPALSHSSDGRESHSEDDKNEHAAAVKTPGGPTRAHAAPVRERKNAEPVSSKSERKFCSFCKHNGESEVVFTAHHLKDCNGDVVCPYLKQYVCPQCGATGAKAHTKRFCPFVDETYSSVYAKTSW
ncbi:nanos homolog 3 [Triplophysa rosa]|uniref:Nanos n=1 Tax=Triplophysa rosa TaxID=992332 RepID=A0A9W7X0E7_TRIRA|nr:nanos homolog 3 [Triplophysa rosa]KAI7811381.1 nanos [Triplophysa rosa]